MTGVEIILMLCLFVNAGLVGFNISMVIKYGSPLFMIPMFIGSFGVVYCLWALVAVA